VTLLCFISLALSEVAWNKKESLEALNDSSTFLHQLFFHWQTFHLLPFYLLANTLLLKVTSLWFRCLPLSEATRNKKGNLEPVDNSSMFFWSTDISSTDIFCIGQPIIFNIHMLKWNCYDLLWFRSSLLNKKGNLRVCQQHSHVFMLTFISVIDILSAAFLSIGQNFLAKSDIIIFRSLVLSEVAWNKKRKFRGCQLT